MDASNLASCLTPTLLPIPEDKDQVQYLTHTIELIRTTITHHEEIFPSDGNGPIYEKFAITVPMYDENSFIVMKKNILFGLVMAKKMKMMKELVNVH